MATYIEIRNNFNLAELRNRVTVAIAIAANKVMTGADNVAPFSQIAGAHILRVAWAKDVFGKAESQADAFLQRMLAENNTLTIGQITGATDAGLQTAVDETVDLFAGVAV